jgi:hypothetical protein
MSGMQINTPLPETVHLCDENFPYWIKLQRHKPETNTWVDASPSIVLPLLEAGIFDEKGLVFNANNIASVLQRRPDIVGKVAGRVTSLQQLATDAKAPHVVRPFKASSVSWCVATSYRPNWVSNS